MEFMNHPIFRASNRYHVPTKEMTQDLYKLYELLRDLNLSLRSKQMSFETAADCSDSWQIVCISYDAAKVIDSTESAKGLRRAHPISRKQRAERMFSEGKMAKGELIRYFFEKIRLF